MPDVIAQRQEAIATMLRDKARGYGKDQFIAYTQYLDTGKVGNLPFYLDWVLREIHELLAPINDWGAPEDAHLAAVTRANAQHDELRRWIEFELDRQDPSVDVVGIFRSKGTAHLSKIDEAIQVSDAYGTNEQPNSLARLVLGLDDAELGRQCLCEYEVADIPTIQLLARHAPERLTPAVLHDVFKGNDFDEALKIGLHDEEMTELATALLQSDPKTFEPQVLDWHAKAKQTETQWALAHALATHDPNAHADILLAAATSILERSVSWHRPGWMLTPSLAILGDRLFPQLLSYYSSNEYLPGYDPIDDVKDHLTTAQQVELLTAAVTNRACRYSERIQAIKALEKIGNPATAFIDQVLTDMVEKVLDEAGDHYELGYVLNAIDERRPEAFIDLIWPALSSKTKGNRQVAATFMAKRGSALTSRIVEGFSDKYWGLRHALVLTLKANGDPQAPALLEQHLATETNDQVRDEIYRTLMDQWRSSGRSFTIDDIRPNMERNRKKLTKPLAKWLDADALPDLHLHDGSTLDSDMAKYLLFRQKRSKEPVADIEASVLIQLLNRNTTGNYAVELLNQFEAADCPTRDRWAVVLAALVGDDRFAQRLATLTGTWARGNKKKLAEMGADCLGVINTEVSLGLLDNLAMRFRSQHPKLADAARSTLEAVARQHGISVEEFGDRIVPWLGFEADTPRIFETDKARFELRIGANAKFTWFNCDKNKAVRSMPKAIPEDTRNLLKEQAKILKRIHTHQISRLETLMVKQHRWPIADWRALYTRHPILRPFTMSQIWAQYADDGSIGRLFRAMEDGSYVDADDEDLDLGDAGLIGLVHPLEMESEQIDAWQTHIADYEIEPHFSQLDREVMRLPDAQADLREERRFDDLSFSSYALRSRMHKRGWEVGSLEDGYTLRSIVKSFPRHQVDFVWCLNDMPYYGYYEEYGNLGPGYFVTPKPRPSWYEYDEPADAASDGVIPFKQVPAIVYSEVMRDLQAIAGAELGEQQDDS